VASIGCASAQKVALLFDERASVWFCLSLRDLRMGVDLLAAAGYLKVNTTLELSKCLMCDSGFFSLDYEVGCKAAEHGFAVCDSRDCTKCPGQWCEHDVSGSVCRSFEFVHSQSMCVISWG